MDQFMDQVKSFVRVLVNYRFWIAISVAAMLSGVAYLLGSGPIRDKTKKESDSIVKAEKDVKQFQGGGLPNDQFKPLIEEKTAVLEKDVNSAWRTLYNRQVPLLTWPETVQTDFQKWGRGWPENVDVATVQLAIVNYAEAYPDYVKSLYKICKPFDLEKMEEGVVMAPPPEALLRPAVFDINKLPDLGKVWATQERHWTQRTLLEVIAAVNKKAKNWDEAIIKQIQGMEVGTPLAQDQRSMANEDELVEAPAIVAPGEEAVEEEAAPVGGGGRGRGDDEDMGGGFRGGNAASASVFYIDKGQYKIMPVFLAVLIDQERIQNLLVELENSPMSVQVMDYEMARPAQRVIKPDLTAGIYNQFGDYGMMESGRGRRGMSRGFGGREGYSSGMGMGGGFGGRGGRMGGISPFGGAVAQQPQGTDLRGARRKETREEMEKAMLNAKVGPSLFDPYFNIVEVKVYGQARFYNPPPALPEDETSPGETPSTEDNATAAPAEPADAKAAPDPATPAEAPEPEPAAAPADAKAAPADAKAAPAPAAPQ